MTPSFQNPRGFEINAGDVIDRSENVLNQFRLFNSLQSKDLRDKIDASNTLLAAKTSLMDDNPVVETPDGEAVGLSKGQRALLLSAVMMAGTNPYMKPLLGTLTSLYESDITEKNALLRAKRMYEMQEMKDRDTAFKELQNKIFFDKGITKEGKKLLLQNLKEQYQAGEYPQLSTAVEKAEQPRTIKKEIGEGKSSEITIEHKPKTKGKKREYESVVDITQPEDIDLSELEETVSPQIFAEQEEGFGKPITAVVNTKTGEQRYFVPVKDPTSPVGYRLVPVPTDDTIYKGRVPTSRGSGSGGKTPGFLKK